MTAIQPPTDAERLAWALKYGHVKTLGTGMQDFDYQPITLEIIDAGIARMKMEAE
jgi:hypothetical protein